MILTLNRNPFELYDYDFTKCLDFFGERTFEFMDLPIVNDVFIVFPYKMLENFMNAVVEMETNPPHGVNVGMHNLYYQW